MKELLKDKNVVGIECKFVTYLPAQDGVRPDTHVVKEAIHYKDGTTKPNLRLLTNFKVPFWITKKHKQNHKDKKESEILDNLNKYLSTRSNLHKSIATQLGPRYTYAKSMRDVISSPYLYGTDISSEALVKSSYEKKWPNLNSPYSIATFDIETDTITDEIIIISVATYTDVYTYILKKSLQGRNEKDVIKELHYLYDTYIPKTDISEKITPHYFIVDSELDVIKQSISKLHELQPDFAAIWNIDYDIPKILETLEKFNVDPKNIFSDPSLPKGLRYFKYKQGMKSRTTEAGVTKLMSPEEQWHTVIAPSSFFWIDAMSSHRYIRVGGKATPGGYSLDNILKQELGKKFMKLKFKDEKSNNLEGLEWHRYMVKERILYYIIYNQWDNMSMLDLDHKTKDLVVSLPMLSGISPMTIFNSGPKRIVEAMHFFYIEKGMVLGAKDARIDNDKLLGLGSWIHKY